VSATEESAILLTLCKSFDLCQLPKYFSMQALLSGGTFPEDISSLTSCMLCSKLEMIARMGETWLL